MSLIIRLNKYFRISNNKNVTRSYGLLEYFLAIQRAKIANKFIARECKYESVLDIGCGSYPIFLLASKFVKKFGIDKTRCTRSALLKRLELINHDIEKGDEFSFADNSIDVVTMLAVFEHIEHSAQAKVLSEIRRVLRPGGLFIMTVPQTWADGILKIMVLFKLVSSIETRDHKTNLKTPEILKTLKEARFDDIKSGIFMLGANRWFVMKKQR